MSEEIKEILEDVKRHLDYVNATGLKSIRDNEMKAMYDYITNLQENYERIYNENCKLREEHNITDISLLDENNRLKEENIKLKELCDKYEEEHSTTFIEWQKDINIIDELTEEYINYMTKQDFAKKCNISRPYLDKLLKKMNRKEIYEFCKIRNKLKGDNK